MNNFECRYEVDDGYVGKSRPITFWITIEDIHADLDEKELSELFDEFMQEHFEQNIFPFEKNKSDFIAWAKEKIGDIE